jgi:hypothetical protein
MVRVPEQLNSKETGTKGGIFSKTEDWEVHVVTDAC